MKHKEKERVTKGHRKLNRNTQNVKQKDTERETEGHRMCNERTQNVKQKDTECETEGRRTQNRRTPNVKKGHNVKEKSQNVQFPAKFQPMYQYNLRKRPKLNFNMKK